jgi:hypothetical protein
VQTQTDYYHYYQVDYHYYQGYDYDGRAHHHQALFRLVGAGYRRYRVAMGA